MSLHHSLITGFFVFLISLPNITIGATESRVQLKTYFETGDVPTEAQFATLIDSFANTPSGQLTLSFDFGENIDDHSVSLNRLGVRSVGVNQKLMLFNNGDDIGSAPAEDFVQSGGLGTSSLWLGESGFLGLEFELIDGEGVVTNHYGFVQMSVDDAASATPYAIHIDAFAYETTPDTTITAFTVSATPVPIPLLTWLGSATLIGLLGAYRINRKLKI